MIFAPFLVFLFFLQIPISDQFPQAAANETNAVNSTNAAAKLPMNGNPDEAIIMYQESAGGANAGKLVKDMMILLWTMIDANNDGHVTEEEVDRFVNKIEKKVDTGRDQQQEVRDHEALVEDDHLGLVADTGRGQQLEEKVMDHDAFVEQHRRNKAAAAKTGLRLLLLLGRMWLHVYLKDPSSPKMDKESALETVRTGMHSLLKLGDINKDGEITRQEVEKAFSALANGQTTAFGGFFNAQNGTIDPGCVNNGCWYVARWKLCEQMVRTQQRCETNSTKQVCEEKRVRNVKAMIGSNKTKEVAAEVREVSEKVCTMLGNGMKECARNSKLAVDLCTEAVGTKRECVRVHSKKACMKACNKVGTKMVCKEVCTGSQQGCAVPQEQKDTLKGALLSIKAGLDGFGF